MLKTRTRTTSDRKVVFNISHSLGADAEIYYSLDGSDPSTSGILYAGEIEVSLSSNIYLKAILKQGDKIVETLGLRILNSEIPSGYDLPELVLSQEKGNDSDDCRVSIVNTDDYSSVDGVLFYYTIDGDNPTTEDPYLSNSEDDVIVVQNGTVKIQAIAGSQRSPVASIVIDDLRVNFTEISYRNMD